MPTETLPAAKSESSWVGDVLWFWFKELVSEDWFRENDKVDHSIRQRFLRLHETLVAEGGVAGDANARTSLAAIIVLDQFSRNMFRGLPRAFATDVIALELARSAIARGFDHELTNDERLFLYLPFEHSENVDDQARSEELVSKLNDEKLTRYAAAHRDIINRFGRFPHRNALLERVSTPEEVEFLKHPGSGF
jgi:uncharacterized protein (DUF924 family)